MGTKELNIAGFIQVGISLLTLAVMVHDNLNEVDPVFSFDFSTVLIHGVYVWTQDKVPERPTWQ